MVKSDICALFFFLFNVCNILTPPVSRFLCLKIKEEKISPKIKLEPHEVDQFLNLSPKGQFFPLLSFHLLHFCNGVLRGPLLVICLNTSQLSLKTPEHQKCFLNFNFYNFSLFSLRLNE